MAHELVRTLQQSTGQPIIQRFAFCESGEDCPERDKGERDRARSGSMIVAKQAGSIKGLLVGNFAIGSDTVRKDLASNAEWMGFVADMATAPTAEWEILGFTDCHGSADLNKSLRQKRAEAVHNALPTQARGKVSGFKGAPLPECIAANDSEQGRARNRSALIWTVHVPGPAKAPTLSTAQGPFDREKCPRPTSFADPAQVAPWLFCTTHCDYVNYMYRAVANMKQVATPYAPGLADFYSTMLKEVVKAGQDRWPTRTTPQSYTLSNLAVRVSSTTTLTVSSITLNLVQSGNINGSYSGGVLTLNEYSSAAATAISSGDPKEIERVMYAEGLHFLSGEVSVANRQARRQTPRGALVQEEFDYELTNMYRAQFEAAVEPFWKDVLSTKSQIPIPRENFSKKLSASIGIHWLRASNEIIDRVEEAVYLGQRAGKGFSMADLTGLPNRWLFTAAYWNPVLVSVSDMQAYIDSKRTEINAKVVPVIQDVQKAYFRARSGS
ncbi:MAG: hypothetical protein JXA14_21155 [Anaerolineae bacterium]|nr:hypothetical protein [Anaerolineae bacterium]